MATVPGETSDRFFIRPVERLTRSALIEFARRDDPVVRAMHRFFPIVGPMLFLIAVLGLIIPINLLVLIAMIAIPILFAAISVVYEARLRRARQKILTDWLCLRCGYPLRHSATSGPQQSACPECGQAFDRRLYEDPPASS